MKINLRESLNKIDLATDNKYDLLNTFDSKKLSDNSKKKLAEAIENNSMASVNRILHESEEQLFKVVIQSGATKRNFESALYEDEAEEIVDYYGGRWIDENGFEWNMYVEEDDDSIEHAMVDIEESLPSRYWEPEDDRTDEEKYQDWLDKGAIPNYDDEEPPFESLKEASYGGAYDVEDDMYFTKEEIIEFADNICEDLAKEFGYKYDIADVYMDSPTKLHIELIDNHDVEVDINVRIDMRKIKKPSDLEKAYHNSTLESFKDRFLEEYQYYEFDESLTEDTVKQNRRSEKKFNSRKDAEEFINKLPKEAEARMDYFDHENEDGSVSDWYEVYYWENPLIEDTVKTKSGKWVNKGDTGKTHGKFKTKKAADAQRKAMFANGYKAESLKEKLIPAPQEVVDELLAILEKYDFVLDDSLKHPIGKTWSGNTHVQVINKDSNIEETDDPDIYSEQLMRYIPDSMENEIDKLSDRSGCRITYNFGANRNWQVTGGLDVWEKYVPGLQDESLKEQVSFPGYAVKYTSGYAGNGVNSSETEWFRTREERDKRAKELKDKNYIEIKTWKMDNFYHTPPKNESLNEAYEYLYNQPFLKTFDEFVSKVSGLKADELDDEVWNEYFHDYQVYNEKYKVKDFENKLRKSLEEKDLEVISIEPNETATLVTVKFDGKEKKFRFKFRLFDVNDDTEEYYIHYIVSMTAGYFDLNESLKEDYDKLFGYNMLSSTLKDGGDTYALLRKTEDGKTKWAAAKYVNGIPDEDNIFEITYEQARGFEPLTDTGKMSRKLGKALLPKKENLKEDLSDLDLILNTPIDTKQFNEETFKALKNLVSEYKKDLDSLDQWALESEKEPFVKKWYKLADKCKEIAKNGIRGITGYGRLNDFVKFKVVDLARSVDNTFPWYTRNNLAKFNKLESLNEDLSSIQEVKQLNFNNNRVNNLRGIFSVKNLVKALNDTGLDALKIRTSRLNNISSGDLKDSWYDLRRNGWTVSIERDPSLSGFNEVYVFEKIKNESLKEAFDDEIDLDYETDFDDDGVEEGNVFVEGGVEYAWVQREAGPLYLDFDKWAVWSAREYVDPREFMTIHDDGKGYDFDGDAFKEKAMAAPIVYFVVDEDTGFIDWGPEDNEIAAKDFLNGKKEDWENDMDESLNEDKELKEYYSVNLHYEDIGDGREYDYEADYDDVLEYLMEYCVDDDNAPEDTQEYMEWVVDNFDYLFKKYEDALLKYFYEDASQEEYDERHSSYEPEYDPMD